VNAGGSPTRAGSGNGSPPRRNRVSLSALYVQHRQQLQDEFPRLREEEFFRRLEAYMVICDPEDDAFYVGGFTWVVKTPEGTDPPLTIYFTYAPDQITLQAVDEVI
jgi:hypothetical protein